MLLDALAAELKSLRPQVGQVISPEMAMRLTLSEALRGSGYASPNPLVGCVVVDSEHRFLGSGAHLRYGERHAEANAMLGIHGAHTTYVTLEPCSHFGKQPPCADMLVREGVKHVICAMRDPAPHVDGAGFAKLKAAGITVEDGPKPWADAAAEINEFFLHEQKTKRVFVGLKIAKSSDGYIAQRGDKRAWITDARSRAYGHFLRQRYDAILVGPQTILLDNPSLTVRDTIVSSLRPRTPWRIVYDYRDNLAAHIAPERMNILNSERDKTIWVTPRASSQEHILSAWGVTHIESSSAPDLLAQLYQRDIRSLLVEGGSSAYAAFIDCFDKLHLFESPIVLAKNASTGDLVHWLGRTPYRQESEFLAKLRNVKTAPLEQDILKEFTP